MACIGPRKLLGVVRPICTRLNGTQGGTHSSATIRRKASALRLQRKPVRVRGSKPCPRDDRKAAGNDLSSGSQASRLPCRSKALVLPLLSFPP